MSYRNKRQKVYVQSWTYRQKSGTFVHLILTLCILKEKILVYCSIFVKLFCLIRTNRDTTEMEAGAYQRSR